MNGYFSLFFVIFSKFSNMFLLSIPSIRISSIIGFSTTENSIIPELLVTVTVSK